MSQRTGQPILRGEDVAFLTGSARYTADVQDTRLRGALSVHFVRSPFAHAEIISIDTEDAETAEGVHSVLTGHDLVHVEPLHLASSLPDSFAPPLLATSTVRFAGQAVAAVLAETAALAADAAERVTVEYEPLEPVIDIEEALAASPLDQVSVGSHHDSAAFDRQEVTITLRSWNPRQSPAPIEALSVAASWQDDELYVWAATQRPHGFRDTLAQMLSMEAGAIHVVAPEVGGGFGGKVSRTAEEYVVPIAAKLTGHPVRWNGTRSEYFLAATQGRGERVAITLAGARDGTLGAIRVELAKDGGAYPLVGVMLGEGYGIHHASGCYDIPHVEFAAVAALTNTPGTSAFRGAGRAGIIAALERAIDMFAAEISMDPAELRARNLIRPDQMPYITASGATYDEADYPADLAAGLEQARYQELRAEQRARRAAGDTIELGIGIASYNQMTVGGGGEEAAVRIESDGTATVVTGTTSQGHGHATTWAQITSDVLGMPVESIRVVEGDTDQIPTGVGAVGSRSLQTAGLAVHNSSQMVLDRAKALAADHFEASEADIVTSPDGSGLMVIGTPARSVSWAHLAQLGVRDTARELSCGEFYDTLGRNTFPSGCHVAVVELDTETGMVVVRRLIAVDDAGVRVNPMIVEGQIHGGIANGIAQVLGEQMMYDPDGNPVTANFADYAIGTIDQLPLFELVSAETATSMNALGFKGVGESGIVGAVPAVHNAVLDALTPHGVSHLDLPCTPHRVWTAIQTAAEQP